MADQNDQKKKAAIGRGRGRGKKNDGPWTRSQKLEQVKEVRKPIKNDEGETKKDFSLTPSSFPPLPSPTNSAAGSPEEKNTKEQGNADSEQIMSDGDRSKKLQFSDNENDDKKDDKADQTNKNKELNDNKADNKEDGPNNDDENKASVENDTNVLSSLTVDTASSSAPSVSGLSPFAKEFVPMFSMNPTVKEFIPGQNNKTNDPEENPIPKKSKVFFKDDLVEDLEETLLFCYTKLLEEPALFDELMPIVMPHFEVYLGCPDLVQRIAQQFFYFTLENHQFAYIAVRLLVFLMDFSQEHLQSQELRSTVLSMAQEEIVMTQEERLDNPEVEPRKILGCLCFVSELYIKLLVGDSRLLPVGKGVVETLKKLLNTARIPIKERLVMTVNVLKLTGTFLDEDDRDLLDDLLCELSSTLGSERDNLDQWTIDVVEFFLTLRYSNWGKEDLSKHGVIRSDDGVFGPDDLMDSAEGSQEYKPNPNDPNAGFLYTTTLDLMRDMVFYGPDGVIMDPEEQRFLESNTEAQSGVDNQGDLSPGSMDGEMEEAYNEFLLSIPLPQHPTEHPHKPSEE